MSSYPTVLRIVTADILLTAVVIAVPYCPCVLFNTTGKFYSPNYPGNLENIECLFYHFRAPPGSLVQITFSTFSLPVRNPECTSSLRIFDSSPDGLVDPDESPSFTFCGHEIVSGTMFYSRDEHMLLQIQHGSASSKGFIGEYRFLPKENYLNDGVEIADCSYRVEKTKGVLYSPGYPYYYRSYINCTYILPQRKGHRIVLSSGEILLGKEASVDIFETTNGDSSSVLSLRVNFPIILLNRSLTIGADALSHNP
ncbi:CUB domain protein [Necator americanus]|uniref:CUB domain protein n=1 Tax=Necator americanus TaxID=51031 RepID=W2SIB0_NECAM|nr:CUB domain protein [Necator americanus]ETN69389.1 CUB domain protein [Necator americanus]